MSNLFYFTGGGKARKHYVDTILGNVSLPTFNHFLTTTQKETIKGIYTNQPIKVWGAIPGKNNKIFYDTMNIGDTVLIYYEGHFSHLGYVALKIVNESLARYFWGVDENGKTWELIYFLKDVSYINLSLDTFTKGVGYAANWIPQGFGKLRDDILRDVLKKYKSIGNFINLLLIKTASVDAIVREAISFHQEEDDGKYDEEREKKVEINADNFYKGLTEKERKQRAWDIYLKLREVSNSVNPGTKTFKATRYERGPAGKAIKEIYDYKCMIDECRYNFVKKNGELYAEAHHLESLSDGGLDDPRNIIVLCPNHHRQFHYANVKKIFRDEKEMIIEIMGSRITLSFKKEA